jgi:multimeric flavodoxin WrbA
MKIVAVQSSPNIEGLTSKLSQAVLRGVKAEGGETELIHLNDLEIRRCHACEQGWGECREGGICTIEDDFSNLKRRITGADSFVFATPVYFGDLSESAKSFLDRLRRVEAFSKRKSFEGKKVIGIAAAGGSGRGVVQCLYNLEVYLRRIGFDVFDLVPVTRSSKDYKVEMLESAGRRLVLGKV